MKAIFLCERSRVKSVYGEDTVALLKEKAGLCTEVINKAALAENPERFCDTEIVFSTWGMPRMTEEEIKSYLPKLKAVFYAAGSVQAFARPFLNCGVKVFSAWAANAVPVAEYTVAQIILANKGFFRSSALMSVGKTAEAKKAMENIGGNMDQAVGIIGAGMIGKLVIKMLKAYRLNVLVFDPFLSDGSASELGVEKCSLERLFASCSVVSNHLANNAQTKGMLCGRLFELMPQNGTFLNTGRGAQVVESELIEVLKRRPDLTAILDVTAPEPPVENSEFFKLDNCILTPHIAGSLGNEVRRMSEYMAEEYLLFAEGKPCKYEVTEKMLETMA